MDTITATCLSSQMTAQTAAQHAELMQKVSVLSSKWAIDGLVSCSCSTKNAGWFDLVPELCVKVENLNVLQDSNRFLREEKNSLEQQVTRLVARVCGFAYQLFIPFFITLWQVKWFEGEMGPLSENNRLLSAQKDTLLAEKAALKNEVCLCVSVLC